MSSWNFNQASSTNRRATMVLGHILPESYGPDSGLSENVQHDRPSWPMVAHPSMVMNEYAHHTLPSVDNLFQVADNRHVACPPAPFFECQEGVQPIEMISPPLTPSSPMDLSIIVGDVKRLSESLLVAPVSQTRKKKRQRLSEMTPKELKACQELDFDAGNFLDKVRSSAEKAKKLLIPQKKAVPCASDSKTRHNVSQTHLRSEKGSKRLTLQRLLCSMGFISGQVQTKKNALSSGLIYEEVALLDGAICLDTLCQVLLDVHYKPEHKADIMAMLPRFHPDEVRPEDDSEAAKFKVMKEADQPFRWQDMRDEGEVRKALEKLKSFAKPSGKMEIDDFLANMSKPEVARL